MNCICLAIGKPSTCHACLIRPQEVFQYYQPTEEDMKEFCQNSEKFPLCPRLIGFQKIKAV